MATQSLITAAVVGTGAYSPAVTFEILSGGGTLIDTTVITTMFVPTVTGNAVIRVRSAQDPTKFDDVTIAITSPPPAVDYIFITSNRETYDQFVNVTNGYTLYMYTASSNSTSFIDQSKAAWGVTVGSDSSQLSPNTYGEMTYKGKSPFGTFTTAITARHVLNPSLTATYPISVGPTPPLLTEVEIANFTYTEDIPFDGTYTRTGKGLRKISTNIERYPATGAYSIFNAKIGGNNLVGSVVDGYTITNTSVINALDDKVVSRTGNGIGFGGEVYPIPRYMFVDGPNFYYGFVLDSVVTQVFDAGGFLVTKYA